MIKTEIKY